jgi:DNA-directed RNA polymerase specialized sigma24 family protein
MGLEIDEEVFWRARARDREAMQVFLESLYPAVQRMGYGLSGREDVGRGIVQFMMKQALYRLEQWRDAEEAKRWAQHHTVLTGRRAAHHEPSIKGDVLIGKHAEVAYVAFIRALRGLPVQQREAFILHYGEKLNLRETAVAMDCSTSATELHLKLAQGALAPIAGEAFAGMRERMVEAYEALTPGLEAYRPTIRKVVERAVWPRRVARLVKMAVAAGVIAGVVWAWRRWGGLSWRW